MSGECAAGRHATCPGYYKMAHPCPCSCHRRPKSASLPWEEAPDTFVGSVSWEQECLEFGCHEDDDET